MKRIILITSTVLVVLYSCSSLSASLKTADEAEMMVTGWLKADPQPLGTNLGREVSHVKIYVDNDDTPIYYIVNLQPTGFVIVSADDLVEPIVGFVDSGTYDPSLKNPLGALVTGDLNGRLAATRSSFRIQTMVIAPVGTSTQKKWKHLINSGEVSQELSDIAGRGSISDVRVEPFVQSKWGQGYVNNKTCFNYYTPNNYFCGCVATAMAQLMRYHRYPMAPQRTDTRILGGDGNGGEYKWDWMVMDPGANITISQREAIGALCFDAATSVDMEYGSEGSSPTDARKIDDALMNTFKYTNAINGYNLDSQNHIYKNIGSGLDDMVNPNLDAGYPAILMITGSTAGGHAAVVDGYGYNSSTIYHHLNLGVEWDLREKRDRTYDVWYNLPRIDIPIDNPEYVYDTIILCCYNVFSKHSLRTELVGEIISGRVTDASDYPIKGATVSGELQGQLGGHIHTNETNDNGIYALVGVNSASTYTISATKSPYEFTSVQVTTGTSIDGEKNSGNKWDIGFVARNVVSIDGVVFEDTFPSSSIDRTKWPVVDGASIYNAGYDASSPPYALWMNGTPNGGDLIESKTINLASSTNAILNYRYDKATFHDPPEPGDEREPGPGDDLIISYLSTHGWVELDRQLGVGSHMLNYRLVSIHLPIDALHANFKIRIESIGNPAVGSEIYDNWFVDDVNVVAHQGSGSVKIFEETFPNPNMNSPLWDSMYGVFVTARATGEPSAPYSMNLNGFPGSYDAVVSKTIDMSDFSRAEFSYYYERTGDGESPDSGDDLIISYVSTHGWVELDRQLGSGPDMTSFSGPIRIVLPSDAMHENFKFRIESIGTPSSYWLYDDWFVDDIVVEVWR